MNAKILLGLLAILPLVLGGCTNKCNQPVGKTDLTALEGNKVNPGILVSIIISDTVFDCNNSS